GRGRQFQPRQGSYHSGGSQTTFPSGRQGLLPAGPSRWSSLCGAVSLHLLLAEPQVGSRVGCRACRGASCPNRSCASAFQWGAASKTVVTPTFRAGIKTGVASSIELAATGGFSEDGQTPAEIVSRKCGTAPQSVWFQSGRSQTETGRCEKELIVLT